MPAKNASKYIRKSIDSILSQTYKDFEFIIFDDSSTDNTKSIAHEYETKDKRVKVLNDINIQGISKSLNFCIDNSNGKYIARMDADDIAHPLKLELQSKFLEEQDLDICGTQVSTFCSDNILNLYNLKYPFYDQEIKYCMLFMCPFAHPTILAKRQLFNNNLYNPEFDGLEDYELWSRIINRSIKAANLPEKLLQYRIHNTQNSVKKNPEKAEKLLIIQKNYWDSIKLKHPDNYFRKSKVSFFKKKSIILEFNRIKKSIDKKFYKEFSIYFASYLNVHKINFAQILIQIYILINTVGILITFRKFITITIKYLSKEIHSIFRLRL